VELRALERKDAIDKYTQQIDSQLVKRVKDVVLERLAVIPSLSNLRNHIVHEVVDTPATYADSYNLAAGTPFGLNHGLAQLSFMVLLLLDCQT
jgi:phytoene dehydrogenase-like protein